MIRKTNPMEEAMNPLSALFLSVPFLGAADKAIPPIDAAAPAKIETATFALG